MTKMLINGELVAAESNEEYPVYNPANGEIVDTAPKGDARDVQRAVDAAARAFPKWWQTPGAKRGELVGEGARKIREHEDELARTLTLEQGKPLMESVREIRRFVHTLEHYAGLGKNLRGGYVPNLDEGKYGIILKRPIGVVAAIVPWNFPVSLMGNKIGPALVAGNTVIVKPASTTPLTDLRVIQLLNEAGLPPGVFNIVTGIDARAIGQALTTHPLVRKLSFTGSTATGKVLMAQCAGTVKKVSLELGGNAPFIVFDDADLDAAVAGAVASKYRNAGQTCVCTNRMLVQAGIYEVFAAKLIQAVKTLRVGDGLAGPTEQGPLIDANALAKVESHIEDAVSKGARIVLGGKPHALGGTFFEPTVLTGVTGEMLIAREETFGPVAPLFRFESEQEAIRMANDTEFGLAAYFYTRDLSRAWRVAEALEYGMVGLNTGLISTEVAPFGGVKESGIGREGSRHGIHEYTELKYLCMSV